MNPMSSMANRPNTPAEQVRRWRMEVRRGAAAFGLSPELVGAVCVQESGGIYCLEDGSCNPAAIRPEPGFWKTYAAGIRRWVLGSPQPYDNRWHAFEDLYSCSYGLMQVMYQTALEYGFAGKFPTELCIPEVGLYYGCKILAAKIEAMHGDVVTGLLRYNGGGDGNYPTKILRIKDEIARGGAFD